MAFGGRVAAHSRQQRTLSSGKSRNVRHFSGKPRSLRSDAYGWLVFLDSNRRTTNCRRNVEVVGYHDVRASNQPDGRLIKFITVNLPKIAPEARKKFEVHRDLLEAYAFSDMQYEEFAARVLRRSRGENEDGDYEPAQPLMDW
jgi:hypothetical protein